jgi:uncharacterized membrane protein
MAKKTNVKKEVVRINGRLKEIVTVKSAKGELLHKIINPLMVEFHLKDFFQVIIGASILAIPVGFTEETWHLGETLPLSNALGFVVLSLLFISAFVYYNYYMKRMKEHWFEFAKRVLVTYTVSFFVVAVILTLIMKTPWTTDWLLAFKRTAVVTFPSSMSGTIADVIK